MIRRLSVIAALALALGIAVPAAVAAKPAPRWAGEVHADLVNEQGARVAGLSGNVGPGGIGFGDIVPLSGARAAGIRRPERVRLVAMQDHTVVVQGQHGTSLRLSDRGQGQVAYGYGLIRTTKRRVAVNATGEWDQQPFRPRRGQVVLTVGSVKGPIAQVLSKRYRLVAYSGAKYSRTALLANPSRYRQITGIVIGTGVSPSRLAGLDLARSMHNDGRLVATTARNGVLDRHMYVVSHAHTGQGGVILRREAPRLGYAVHSYPQIREPIFASTRVGAAKARTDAATFTPAIRKAAAAVAARKLMSALSKAERLAPLPKAGKRKSEMQSSTSSDPATVTAGSDDAAYYTVPVNQYISATVTAGSINSSPMPAGTVGSSSGCCNVQTPLTVVWVGTFVTNSADMVFSAYPAGYPPNACMEGSEGIWTDATETTYSIAPVWACAPTPTESYWGACSAQSNSAWAFIITLATENGAVGSPVPLETNGNDGATRSPGVVEWSCPLYPAGMLRPQTMGITYNPIYTVSLAQSTSEVTQQAITETNSAQFDALATPSTAMGAGTFNITTGIASPGQSPSSASGSEAGLGLSMAYHSIDLACTSCTGTSGGSILPVFEAGSSSPTQQVTQVSGGSSTGTSSSTSTNWSTSVDKTSSWDVSETLGFFGPIPMGSVSGGYGQSTSTTNSNGGSTSQGTSLNSSVNFTTSNWTTMPVQGSTQAQYTTYSTTVTGAEGAQANAAYSLPFPSSSTSNEGGFIATPSQYGGNGPAPTCTQGAGCAPPALDPQPAGSGENFTGFTQGSTSYFTLDTSGNQLGVGSATPWVADNFYLFDQGTSGTGSGMAANYLELQVLGQSQVSVNAPTIGTSTSITSSGASGAEGITTYYNAEGQVVNSASDATYQTTGLDLCAPPVLTPDLWTSGCDSDPNFSGPPAVYSGAPPTITTTTTPNPFVTDSSGQTEVLAPAPPLTCNPGSWSGSPSYTYQWQQWSPIFGDWQNISGATSATYTPAASLSSSTYFTCMVTATNALGAVSEPAASVEVVVSG